MVPTRGRLGASKGGHSTLSSWTLRESPSTAGEYASHVQQSQGPDRGRGAGRPDARQRDGAPRRAGAHRRQGCRRAPTSRRRWCCGAARSSCSTTRATPHRSCRRACRCMARRSPTARTSWPRRPRFDRQPLPLRADDPAMRHRARARGAAGGARRHGRALGRACRLRRQGQRRRGDAQEGRRQQRDADGRLAGRLRRRALDGAARARPAVRGLDHGQQLVAGRRPHRRARAQGQAAHLLAPRRYPGLLPDPRRPLPRDRRPRPGDGQRAPRRSDAGGDQRHARPSRARRASCCPIRSGSPASASTSAR